MNISNIILVSSLLFIGNSTFAQNTDSIPNQNSPRMVKKVRYHPATYRNISKKDNYISGFALGLDYSSEKFTDKMDMAWDSSNVFLGNSGGFNMYGVYMPKSIRNWRQNNPHFGNANFGFGFNVNQFHSSRKNLIQISTRNEDSARTHVENSHVSFYGMGRYEWGFGNIYPFFGIQGGVTLASTNQVTEMIMISNEYEQRAQTNMTTTATTYFAPEIGIRVRLNSWFSLVASHEWKYGNQLNLTDVKNVQFNGNDARAPQNSVTYQTGMYKFGVLFDLSGNKHDREIIKEAYYDTIMVMEEEQQNKPCPPCPCEVNTKPLKDSNKSDISVDPSSPQTVPSNGSNSSSTIKIPGSNGPAIPNTFEMPKKKLPTGITPKPVPLPTKKKS